MKGFLLSNTAALCMVATTAFNAKADIVSNLQTNLVGSWTFSGNADDATSAGNHAIIAGAQLTTDRFGNASSALSITSHLGGATTLQDISLTGNASRSISYWTKFTTQGLPGTVPDHYTQSFISWGDESGQGTKFAISQESKGPIWFWGAYADLTYSPAIGLPSFDEWRMITFTYAGTLGSAAAYINGVLQTNIIPGPYNPLDPNAPLNTALTPLSMYGYQGDFIDDVFIYDKALSSQEVTALFQAQSAAVPEPSAFLTGTLLVGAALFSVLKRRKS